MIHTYTYIQTVVFSGTVNDYTNSVLEVTQVSEAYSKHTTSLEFVSLLYFKKISNVWDRIRELSCYYTVLYGLQYNSGYWTLN
jgi:hypothetical protein